MDQRVPLGTTVPEDALRGEEELMNEMRRMVKGKYGTLVTDGATFRRWKVVVVLFVSDALPEPILVSVIIPAAGVGVGVHDVESDTEEDDYSYRAPECALDVRAGMAAVGLEDKYVTNVMGDNVTFNVIARQRCCFLGC
jgi:hypothetical protein